MANGRHSFVAFYPSDWLGGTARLPRLHKSVYFDVCCYIWDLAKPVPASELKLMVADVKGGLTIIDDLIAVGKLDRLEDGSISNSKALHEAEKAQAAWEKMSNGGKRARSNEDASPHDKGDGKPHAGTIPENQNQNQTSPKKEKKERAARPDDVPEAVWKAFVDQRKTIFTPLALEGVKREASKIGWSVADALTKCVERGWQGFDADWIKGNGHGNGSDKRDSVAKALDRRLGLDGATGEAGRRDAGAGEGDRLLPAPGTLALR